MCIMRQSPALVQSCQLGCACKDGARQSWQLAKPSHDRIPLRHPSFKPDMKEVHAHSMARSIYVYSHVTRRLIVIKYSNGPNLGTLGVNQMYPLPLLPALSRLKPGKSLCSVATKYPSCRNLLQNVLFFRKYLDPR